MLKTLKIHKSRSLNKILLSLAAVALISVAALGGTFANFSATPITVAGNAFSAGSLTMTRSGTGAILTATAMKIGDEATGSITINNTGNLAGAYTLTGSNAGSAPLAGQLNLAVYADVDGGSAVYTGSLGGFSSVSLGTFAALTGTHTYYFHVTLPTTGTDAGDNLLQGLTTTETFTWSAIQA